MCLLEFWEGVHLKRTLCGHRECEKLGVLTALEQFQHSVGAGGEPACWIYECAARVRIGSAEEWIGGDEINARKHYQKMLVLNIFIMNKHLK